MSPEHQNSTQSVACTRRTEWVSMEADLVIYSNYHIWILQSCIGEYYLLANRRNQLETYLFKGSMLKNYNT